MASFQSDRRRARQRGPKRHRAAGPHRKRRILPFLEYLEGRALLTGGDGLPAYTAAFTLDNSASPRITNTIFVGRTVVVQFSEAMSPETINRNTVELFRTGPSGQINGPDVVRLNDSPLLSVTYDSATNRAVIDLSAFSQDQLPRGTYALRVSDTVTDLSGNRLDGEFNGPPPSGNFGRFPSGDGKPNTPDDPQEDNDNDPFIQVFSNVEVRAPQFLSLGIDQAGSTSTNPRIIGTLQSRQAIEIYFNQPMDPASISRTTILLERSNYRGTNFSSPILINNNPRLTVRYDAISQKAVIDLSALTDAELPQDDTYRVRVLDSVQNLVDTDPAQPGIQGARLDGEFSGVNPLDRRTVFPTGDGKLGQAENSDNDPFVQILPPFDTSGPPVFLSHDSGIAGDQNTNVTRPRFVGQVTNTFPGRIAGLNVVVQFNGLHNGSLTLRQGAGGIGFDGTFDVRTTTDENGRFSFEAPADLPDGFQIARVIVWGESEQSNPGGTGNTLPGPSRLLDISSRVDTTKPTLSTSLVDNTKLSSLTSLTLDIVDPVEPQDIFTGLTVPTQLQVPALNPVSANNINNYSLIFLGADGKLGGTGANADFDRSSFIIGATYTDTSQRLTTQMPFTGRIELRFATGLAAGKYMIIARRPQPGYSGITDAAGNPIDGDPNMPGAQDFEVIVDLLPVPAYVTQVKAVSNPRTEEQILSNPRSFFEQRAANGAAPRRGTPTPTEFWIDFSSPLDPNADYSQAVQLIRSADSPLAPADGDFGLDSTFTNGIGYTRVTNVSVTLTNSIPGAQPGEPGFMNRLILRYLPQGDEELPADSYRLFLPNVGQGVIRDIYNNQLDGEFLGNETPLGDFETQLPTGEFRAGLSGDGVEGGAFETGFLIVPYENIIYARPDYYDDPFLATDDPDGSLERPYAALAPEAVPSPSNNFNVNDPSNFGPGFDPRLDRNQNGRFDRSALYAAQVASVRGPVVVVALPGTKQRDPVTGATTQQTFVMAAPAGGVDPLFNNASASVPYNTTLVFEAGAVLKLQNASLFVQNQGSALQVRGGVNPEDRVYFTSFSDDEVAGDTNGDGAPGAGGSSPNGGDWGGIVFRNYTQAGRNNRVPFPVDGRLKGPGDSDARIGADEALSVINFATINYGGGPVPRTLGASDGPITLFNTRPAITNTLISNSRTVTDPTNPDLPAVAGTVGAITADFDSFREDELARGPLIRRVELVNNSINGIFIRAGLSGEVRQSDAVAYPNNPAEKGGTRNFTIDDPLPHVLTTRLIIGQEELVNTGGATVPVSNRLMVQPGMMFKMPTATAIDVLVQRNPFTGAANTPSINFGDRTYMAGFDRNPDYSPNTPGFRSNTVGDATILFTSLYDDDAETFYRDPNTGAITTIVPQIDTDGGGRIFIPTPGNVPLPARWGGVAIDAGARAVIDEVEFRYGGGSVNTATTTIQQRDVLAFQNATSFVTSYDGYTKTYAGGAPPGTKAKVTNNNFFDNLEAPISIEADGLLAADPLTPLQSGNPFFRGNVMLRNTVNGLEVIPTPQSRNGTTVFGFAPNLRVDSIWDDTDLTYLLRTTIVLDGADAGTGLPVPDPNQFLTQLKPFISLTIQSSMPDLLLADGTRVARPGESAIVKLLNDTTVPPLGDGVNGMPSGNQFSDVRGGAGFLVGFDDGVDPPADPLLDPGAYSQIRIVGIGGNETTGQERVPVYITSMRDDTIGRTVRGFEMFQAISGNTTAPAPGDGGVIGFGALSLTDYNLFDPRDGNLIDNADIRYMTRIDLQGGGIVDVDTANLRLDKLGITEATQFNSAKAMTISNSRIRDFSQVGVIAHPSGVNALIRDPLLLPDFPARTIQDFNAGRGQPVLLNMVNNIIADMPVGVRINAETTNDDSFQSPFEAVFLNNTFYNTPVGIHTEAPAQNNAPNDYSHVHFLAMDNIFEQTSTAAIEVVGQAYGSQAQFNLFNTANAVVLTNASGWFGNNNPIIGNALFRDPSNGDFTLLPGSDAIDAGLSELSRVNLGRSLQPIVDYPQGINPADGGVRNSTGRNNSIGGKASPFSVGIGSPGSIAQPGDIVTLPGFANRIFEDQWVPALPDSLDGVDGPTRVPGAFKYKPIGGERDLNGFLRIDDPTNPRLGAGSRPFFDVGASERRIIVPPRITEVRAVITDPTQPNGISTVDYYVVGGIRGSNTAPLALQFQLDARLDPRTVTNRTVILEASGGDGLFGNANNASDRAIDLSGKLSYNANTRVITIDLSGINPPLANDLYRVTLRGSGSEVIRDPQGIQLDGENTANNLPTGAHLDLPSGDRLPGGNFYFSFSIDSTPPAVGAGSLALDAASDSGPRDNITNNNTPTFTGTVTDIFPPANPAVGQIVYLDFAGPDGKFGRLLPGSTPRNPLIDPTDPAGADDRLNIGTALTTDGGFFTVTVGVNGANVPGLNVSTAPLPDSIPNVGPDGWLGPNPTTGVNDDILSTYSLIRVRVEDQSGNSSNPDDKNAQLRFVVDTRGPRVVEAFPAPNSAANVSSSGALNVRLVLSETIDTSTLSDSSLTLVRSGGDNVFGDGGSIPDVPIPIPTGAIRISPLFDAQGRQVLEVTLMGLSVNDLYRLTLVGTDVAAIRDIATNDLDGEFQGSLPSGNGIPGGDFNLDFVVLNTANTRIRFVDDDAGTGGDGSRSNPFRTISEAIAAANVGDTIAVLPGLYLEQITLKSLVRIVSASVNSSDQQAIPGNPLDTVLRSPTTATSFVTVTGTDLISLSNFQTEISGFAIANPLQGNLATGRIIAGSVGVQLVNSDVLVSRNYIINSEDGIQVSTSGVGARAPRIQNNVIAGNEIGVHVIDQGTVTFASGRPTMVVNNTIAFNTTGLLLTAGPTSPAMTVRVVNNIFASNFLRSGGQRTGLALESTVANKMLVQYNLFDNNGPTPAPGDDAVNIGGGFNPANLGATPDIRGNIAGRADFVNARDPRPPQVGDGPAIFLTDANFDLNLTSDAIDVALDTVAPLTDFRSRIRVDVAGRGYNGTRADIGASEFVSTGSAPGTITQASVSRVSAVTFNAGSKLSGKAAGRTTKVVSSGSRSTITIRFSRPVLKSSVQAMDLLLSGSGINSKKPVKVTGVTWINSRTVQFKLSGTFRNYGIVKLTIARGAVVGSDQKAINAFRDTITLRPATTVKRVSPKPATPKPSKPKPKPATPKPPSGTPWTPPGWRG